MSLQILNPTTTNCNCNDDNLNRSLESLDIELANSGNKLYLSQIYEIGKEPTQLEIFNLISRKDILDTKVNMLCPTSSKIFHTEEIYLEKYCH